MSNTLDEMTAKPTPPMTMGEILSDVYDLGGDCVDKEYAIAEALTQISARIEGAIPPEKDQLSQSTLEDESRCRFYRYGGYNFARQEIKDNLKKIGLIL